jgi:hypothetical protein
MALAAREPGRALPTPQPRRDGAELGGTDVHKVLDPSVSDPLFLAPGRGIRNAVIASAVFWAALAVAYFLLR